MLQKGLSNQAHRVDRSMTSASVLTMAHSTALSMLTSSNTMRQLLPPSSMQVGTPLFAASAMMRRPVTVLPVKLILAMPGLELHRQS